MDQQRYGNTLSRPFLLRLMQCDSDSICDGTCKKVSCTRVIDAPAPSSNKWKCCTMRLGFASSMPQALQPAASLPPWGMRYRSPLQQLQCGGGVLQVLASVAPWALRSTGVASSPWTTASAVDKAHQTVRQRVRFNFEAGLECGGANEDTQSGRCVANRAQPIQ